MTARRGIIDCPLLDFCRRIRALSNAGFRQRLKDPTRAVVLLVAFATPLALGVDTQPLWIEITTPSFVVVSNAGEKWARDVALHFEQINSVYQTTLPKSRVDLAQPLTILAVQNERDLQELLPQHWERQGLAHPFGCFQYFLAKHFVALRLDAIGANPYSVYYHEYFHILNLRNNPAIPVWLDEGLAEFWGNTRIKDGIVEMGLPLRGHLQILREKNLIPLDVLFDIDRSSPYYNDADKAPLFYAQSWALTHYLLIGEGTRDESQGLTKYLNLLQAGSDVASVVRRTFGSLANLERKLDKYVRRDHFPIFRTDAPTGLDTTEWKARALSPSESLSIRGDFLISGERPLDARPLLREALVLNPDSAHAHESMGLLCYREGNRDEAAKWFDKAIELDAQRFLPHYFHAKLRLENRVDVGELESIEQSLNRSIDLNPGFGPAYAQLANVYGNHDEKLDEALTFAQKAVELEPASAEIRICLGQIWMRKGKGKEARKVGAQALRVARSPEEESLARNFLESVEDYEAFLARLDAKKDPPGEPEIEPVPHTQPGKLPSGAVSQEDFEPREDVEISSANVQETKFIGEPEHREVRGMLSDLQCLPGGSLNFIVSVGNQKYVLQASSLESVLVLKKGKIVSNNLRCGPLHHEVIARFVVTRDEKPGSEVKGILNSLELLRE